MKTTLKNIVVLIADDKPDLQGDILDIDGVSFPNSIPVNRGFSADIKDFLGTATLRRVGNTIVADLELLDEKIPASVYEWVYPAIGGKVMDRDGKKINKCNIESISISGSPNVDCRIGPLKGKDEK